LPSTPRFRGALLSCVANPARAKARAKLPEANRGIRSVYLFSSRPDCRRTPEEAERPSSRCRSHDRVPAETERDQLPNCQRTSLGGHTRRPQARLGNLAGLSGKSTPPEGRAWRNRSRGPADASHRASVPYGSPDRKVRSGPQSLRRRHHRTLDRLLRVYRSASSTTGTSSRCPSRSTVIST
jgi:hypothetical protein